MAEIKIDTDEIRANAGGMARKVLASAEEMSYRNLWITCILIWPITIMVDFWLIYIVAIAGYAGIIHLSRKNYKDNSYSRYMRLLSGVSILMLIIVNFISGFMTSLVNSFL
jgi:hypothetical protein